MQKRVAIGLMAVLLQLAGCGGEEQKKEETVVPLALKADCSGCAATESSYAGSGTGVWVAENTSSSATGEVQIALDGIPDQAHVTLVWTNQSGVRVALPAMASPLPAAAGSKNRSVLQDAPPVGRPPLMPMPAQAQPNPVAAAPDYLPLNTFALGDKHQWTDSFNPLLNNQWSTLRSQYVLSNGRKVNVWVQDSEFVEGRFTQALADTYAENFGRAGTGVYDMVTSLYGGLPWGPYDPALAGRQIHPDEDLQIILAPHDLYSGYFTNANNRERWELNPGSNQVLAFMMTSGDAWNPARGPGYSLPVLGHEFVHMINYYQRSVLHGAHYSDWLEEMSAMALHEMIGNRLNPQDGLGWWHKSWLRNGEYGCSLNVYVYGPDEVCSSYDVGGSFMSYLMRQYGLAFYRDMTAATDPAIGNNPITILDQTIRRQDPASSFAIALRRWGASIALLDTASLPSGYGYPERVEVVNGVTYTLKAINGPDMRDQRQLLNSLPGTLDPYAHAALEFRATAGVFQQTVRVPPGCALTIVVN